MVVKYGPLLLWHTIPQKPTSAHVLHLGFLKRLLGVKEGTDTYCVLRETNEMPIPFYWFRCINDSGTVCSLQTIISWESCAGWPSCCKQKGYMDLSGSAVAPRIPCVPASLDAIRFCESINLKQFELTLRKHIIGGWRELDNLIPHETHHTSRIMRTYHTHFVVPQRFCRLTCDWAPGLLTAGPPTHSFSHGRLDTILHVQTKVVELWVYWSQSVCRGSEGQTIKVWAPLRCPKL
jgi:hypothetical protein